jgi:hypothetical protein
MSACRGRGHHALAGLSHRKCLPENLKALDVTLTKGELDNLDRAFALEAITGDRYSAQMTHLSSK